MDEKEEEEKRKWTRMDAETSSSKVRDGKKKGKDRLLEEEEEGGRVIYKGEGLARNSPRLQMLDRDRERE